MCFLKTRHKQTWMPCWLKLQYQFQLWSKRWFCMNFNAIFFLINHLKIDFFSLKYSVMSLMDLEKKLKTPVYYLFRRHKTHTDTHICRTDIECWRMGEEHWCDWSNRLPLNNKQDGVSKIFSHKSEAFDTHHIQAPSSQPNHW